MENVVKKIRKVDPNFWIGKKVFITGHTGFKGSWLSLWLQNMDANLKGYALNPDNNPNLFNTARIDSGMISHIGDIRDLKKLTESLVDFEPEIIIHMAAQPLVRESYINPIETYQTNVMGTLNLLEASKKLKNLKSVVIITTDKCYENKEIDIGYKESDPMGGYDPYSSSKGCCELLVSSYRRSFFNEKKSPAIATARAGNVLGGGDWSEDRLVPDILKSFENNKKAIIRFPDSIRPWQHVMDPLSGYLILAENLYKFGHDYASSWNFGPDYEDCKTVKWIVKEISERWAGDVKWAVEKHIQPHEAKLLKLDCSKAKKLLNWYPIWNLGETLDLVINWHRSWVEIADMREITLEQINNYKTKNEKN